MVNFGDKVRTVIRELSQGKAAASNTTEYSWGKREMG